MSICIQNADAYFKGRTLGRQWSEYSGQQRTAAIQQARRDLSRALGRPMRDDEPAYKEGDTRRDEYAVYEQAAYTLIRTVAPDGNGDLVQPLEGAGSKKAAGTGAAMNTAGGRFSMEALSWLADAVRVSVTR